MPYRIRKNFRELDGSFSEKDVIKQITRGKLSGDDEFQDREGGKWKKISSHATFYDALLKRLFQEQYPIDTPQFDPTEKSVKVSTPDAEATRREKGTKTRRAVEGEKPEIEAPDDGTMALAEGGKRDGATIHQAEIDELFSKGGEQPEVTLKAKVPDSGEPGKELIIPDEGGASSEEPLGLPVGTVDLALENPPLLGETPPLKKPVVSRKVLYSSVAVLLLVMLFFSGGEKPKVKVETKKVTPELYMSLTDPKRKEETVLALEQQGDILYDKHTPLFYVGAAECYDQALSLHEDNSNILGSLAELEARLVPEIPEGNNDELARGHIASGRVKEPHFPAFYRAEALLALAKNDLVGAVEAIGHAKEVDPANLENFLVEGEVLLAANEVSPAEAVLQKVVSEDPYSIKARSLLSLVKLRKKDYARAKEEVLAVLKLNPIHAQSYYVLGSMAFEQDRVEEAERQYQTFVGLARFAPRMDLSRAYTRLATIQENRGNKAAAIDSFRLAYYYAPERKGELEQKLNGADLTDGALEQLAAKNEYGVSYFRERADNLLLQKNYRQALIFLHAAYLLNRNGEALVRIGDVAEKLADNYVEFRAVSSYYERAIEKDPRLTEAYIKLGLLETDLYNLDRAFMLLKQAQALSPSQAEPYIALGKYFYKARDYTASIEQFTKAFNINPGDPEILYYAGLLRPYGPSGGEKQAMVFFYRAYLLNPTYYEAMIEWLKLKVKSYDKLFAIKFVRNLMEDDPRNANLYWAMGEIYATNKEHRRGIDYFKKALELDRYMSPVRLSLAKSMEAVGDLEKAVLEYRLVTKLDRRNGEGAYRAAELLLDARRFDLAGEVLNELIQISPNYPGAYRYLARIAQSKKKKDESIGYMKKEVQNNPLNAKFRIEFASMLMDYQEFDQAINELTEVTNLHNPKNSTEYVYDKIRGFLLLSRCYRAKNQMESAEGAIRLALETDPDDPELHRELGYVYSGQQRPKEAVKEFEIYLNRNPAAADSGAIRAMIQNMVIEE